MTVADLIEALQDIEDKSKLVVFEYDGPDTHFYTEVTFLTEVVGGNQVELRGEPA